MDCLGANGPIESYVVSYGLSGADGARTNVSTNRKLVIPDLVAGQSYSAQVAARNSIGQGPFSYQITFTLPDGKYKCSCFSFTQYTEP